MRVRPAFSLRSGSTKRSAEVRLSYREQSGSFADEGFDTDMSSSDSACHCTPTRKGVDVLSTASIVPSSAHATAVRSSASRSTAW